MGGLSLNLTFQYQTAFAEKNFNDLKYEMLEKQVGLLNGELKALKTVNDMLKEGFPIDAISITISANQKEAEKRKHQFENSS